MIGPMPNLRASFVSAVFGAAFVLGIAGLGRTLSGCGGSTSDVSTGDAGADGSLGGGPCTSSGQACQQSSDCCTGACDPTTHQCASGATTRCAGANDACTVATDCCSLSCVGGKCGTAACTSDNQPCTTNDQCCGGVCGQGDGGASSVCVPLNTTCKTAGNDCATNDQCCSKLCSGGKCQLASSYCIQGGDVCSNAADCCGGICTIAAGATKGTCGAPPPGATYCNGGLDGTVCNDCTGCCSRLCAPYAPTGVKICQPAEGCHVDGDLCRKDSDCCGAKGSGVPGDGNVTCEIQPGQTIGICRNPLSCNPEGDVCHYQNYTCSISSARNDCCDALGSKTDCTLDALGVPRCHAIGTCKNAGESCAYSGDCCNGAPCLPDANGQLHCGTACSPSTGPCTTTADCCNGLNCIVPLGSTQGTCGAIAPPPPPPGDAGTPPPPTTDGGGIGCAQYGQICTQNSDCCNGVPCTSGTCHYAIQ